ncbi:hypothetical protein AE621_11100 [Acidovorax sp. SD340]|nr:hypothetical protein AE621_11100 [Acidovorax sp. SD340]
MALRRADQDDITRGKTYNSLMYSHQALALYSEDVETPRSLNSCSHQGVRQPHCRIRMVGHRLAIQLTRGSSAELVQNHPPLFMLDQHEAALSLGKTAHLTTPDHVSINGRSIRSTLSDWRLSGRSPPSFNRYGLHLATRQPPKTQHSKKPERNRARQFHKDPRHAKKMAPNGAIFLCSPNVAACFFFLCTV